jgi:hypothetical protein
MGMNAGDTDMSVDMSAGYNMGMSVGDSMAIRVGMMSDGENIGTIGIEVFDLPGEMK